MPSRRDALAVALAALALQAAAGCGGASHIDGDTDAAVEGTAGAGADANDASDDFGGAGGEPRSALSDAVGTDAGAAGAGGLEVMPLQRDGAAGDASAIDAGMPAPMDDVDAATPLDEGAVGYAGAVTSFNAGENAGFGQDEYPDIVLGPPLGGGTMAGSLDVLSLGVGGEIVLDFGDTWIVDGAGADFIVFENPFWPGGDPTQVFAELGEVSVSEDGASLHTFPCDTQGTADGEFAGCAGWTPTLVYDPLEVVPLDPAQTGGDAFDLADLGVTRARYVRIVDLSTMGEGTTAGFDLDAVGLVHYETAP